MKTTIPQWLVEKGQALALHTEDFSSLPLNEDFGQIVVGQVELASGNASVAVRDRAPSEIMGPRYIEVGGSVNFTITFKSPIYFLSMGIAGDWQDIEYRYDGNSGVFSQFYSAYDGDDPKRIDTWFSQPVKSLYVHVMSESSVCRFGSLTFQSV